MDRTPRQHLDGRPGLLPPDAGGPASPPAAAPRRRTRAVLVVRVARSPPRHELPGGRAWLTPPSTSTTPGARRWLDGRAPGAPWGGGPILTASATRPQRPARTARRRRPGGPAARPALVTAPGRVLGPWRRHLIGGLLDPTSAWGAASRQDISTRHTRRARSAARLRSLTPDNRQAGLAATGTRGSTPRVAPRPAGTAAMWVGTPGPAGTGTGRSTVRSRPRWRAVDEVLAAGRGQGGGQGSIDPPAAPAGRGRAARPGPRRAPAPRWVRRCRWGCAGRSSAAGGRTGSALCPRRSTASPSRRRGPVPCPAARRRFYPLPTAPDRRGSQRG